MELNEKLQQLRKQRGLTQDQVADALFVSRTAISKWESGRGYPNIDSLKAIAKYYGISIDELLSGEELLTIAEEDRNQRQHQFLDLSFGLLDLCVILLPFFPFFAQKATDNIREVPLWLVSANSPLLTAAYWLVIAAVFICGLLTLCLRNSGNCVWIKIKSTLSLILNALGSALFIISLQPYAAVYLFIFLIIKVFMLIKSK